eukprot:12265944-Alexandrium_andersonii.AAC.1
MLSAGFHWVGLGSADISPFTISRLIGARRSIASTSLETKANEFLGVRFQAARGRVGRTVSPAGFVPLARPGTDVRCRPWRAKSSPSTASPLGEK